MNLAAEFNSILYKYGHNVFLYRRSDNEGTGPYKNVDIKYIEPLEKWTAYRRPLRAGATASADGFMYLDEEGQVTSFDMCFYFQAESDVKTSDIIIEDTPNEKERRHVFSIKKAVPYYLGGSLIYFSAYCDKVQPRNR